jgi:excisionase family DNA binding protein
MITQTNGDLLTVEQAAARLGLKVVTLRSWMAKRKLGYVRVGERATRIPVSEIARIIERGFVPATPERAAL